MLKKIISLSNKYEDHTINIRRKIHENPELSFQEYSTSNLVISELESLGLSIEKNLAGTGVLATLEGHKEGKTILLRADMDALPIEEGVDLKFKSKNLGIMHACGHDIHISNLLGVARILSDLKDSFNGRVMFMFQPGEERGGGCKKMIKAANLENRGIDLALGLHIMPIEQGKILLSKGNITAFSDGFNIKIFGRSAHTSKPQDGIDAINIAGHIIVALNSIASKYLAPKDVASFSIGKIQGGRSNNIVADYVELSGIIRSTSQKARSILHDKIRSISMDLTRLFAGRAEVKINIGYPSIINDPDLVTIVENAFYKSYPDLLEDINPDFKVKDLNKYILQHDPLLTADDFGHMSQLFPSLYYMVGTGDFAPLHSSGFLADERYIKLCTRTMTLAALSLLN